MTHEFNDDEIMDNDAFLEKIKSIIPFNKEGNGILSHLSFSIDEKLNSLSFTGLSYVFGAFEQSQQQKYVIYIDDLNLEQRHKLIIKLLNYKENEKDVRCGNSVNAYRLL